MQCEKLLPRKVIPIPEVTPREPVRAFVAPGGEQEKIIRKLVVAELIAGGYV